MPTETSKIKKNLPKKKSTCATATGNSFFFNSPIMLLLLVAILLPPKNCLATQRNRNSGTATNDPMHKFPDSARQVKEDESVLRRKREWVPQKTVVLNGQGVSLPAILYTAEYELPGYDSNDPWKDGKIGVLHLETKEIQRTWIGRIPLQDRFSLSFIEQGGEIYGVHRSIPTAHLVFLKSSIPKTKQSVDFAFSSEKLDALVTVAPPVRSKTQNKSLYLEPSFESCFFLRHPLASIWSEVELKKITAENGIFCFEFDGVSFVRRGRVWVDIEKMRILKSENVTHLIEPQSKVKLRVGKVRAWKKEGDPVTSVYRSDAQFSSKVLTSMGTSFPVDVYTAGMAFDKTIVGDDCRELVRIFHASKKEREIFWVDREHLMLVNEQMQLIEINDELLVCCFDRGSLLFINTAVKIEKSKKDFVFSEDALDTLFAEAYAKFPNIPYKFCVNIVYLSDFLGKNFYYNRSKLEKVSEENGIFCIKIKNSFNKRHAKIWIDSRNYRVVKTEEIPASPSKPKTEKQ